MSLNLFIASGHLGNDIEVRYTPNQKCIGTFSLPCESGWGENKKTSWLRCKLLGERAEKLAPFLVKGMKVTVSGRFELEEWTGQDGVKHSVPCIIVNDIDLPPKNDNNMPAPVHKPAAKPNIQLTPEEIEALNDDIPF
jgi:single-strand DNA-binding protein